MRSAMVMLLVAVMVGCAMAQGGRPPSRVLTVPEVKLQATVRNADAVRFVIGSLVSKDGPIEQLVPFVPDASGMVEAPWTLTRVGFGYVVWANALQKPSGPPMLGDTMDAFGNLIGASGAVRLERRPSPVEGDRLLSDTTSMTREQATALATRLTSLRQVDEAQTTPPGPVMWVIYGGTNAAAPWRKGIGVSPKEIAVSPKEIAVSPKEIAVSPKEIAVSPKEIAVSPKEIAVSPKEIAVSPKGIAVSPKEIAVSPKAVTVFSIGISLLLKGIARSPGEMWRVRGLYIRAISLSIKLSMQSSVRPPHNTRGNPQLGLVTACQLGHAAVIQRQGYRHDVL